MCYRIYDMHDFTLFVIDIYIRLCSFHFFRHHLTTFTFIKLWNSNQGLYWEGVGHIKPGRNNCCNRHIPVLAISLPRPRETGCLESISIMMVMLWMEIMGMKIRKSSVSSNLSHRHHDDLNERDQLVQGDQPRDQLIRTCDGHADADIRINIRIIRIYRSITDICRIMRISALMHIGKYIRMTIPSQDQLVRSWGPTWRSDDHSIHNLIPSQSLHRILSQKIWWWW